MSYRPINQRIGWLKHFANLVEHKRELAHFTVYYTNSKVRHWNVMVCSFRYWLHANHISHVRQSIKSVKPKVQNCLFFFWENKSHVHQLGITRVVFYARFSKRFGINQRVISNRDKSRYKAWGKKRWWSKSVYCDLQSNKSVSVC